MKNAKYSLFLTIASILLVSLVQAQQSVSDCVKAAMNATAYKENVCIEVHARVSGPGWSGRRKRASNRNCIVPAEGFAVIGAPSVTKIGCISDRCKADSVELIKQDGKSTQACLRVHTWSSNEPFRGGGSANYRLCADIERHASASDVLKLIGQCEAK